MKNMQFAIFMTFYTNQQHHASPCCNQRARAACMQGFTLQKQKTIDITW